MKVQISATPWTHIRPSQAMLEAVDTLGGTSWRDAAIEFYAARKAKENRGLRTPKGVQPYLNRVIDNRFQNRGWSGEEGRFRKGDTWVRVTFRHQMSLGSDFLDALRLHRKEGVTEVGLFAASRRFLEIITPNDADVIVSFEKMRVAAMELDGCLEFPLFLGLLEPGAGLPSEVEQDLRSPRPREAPRHTR